jgi:hypothetical protein
MGSYQNKFVALLKSRKFWASFLGLASVIVVFMTGHELPVETLVNAIVAIIGLFTVATALEDGLSRRV